MRSSTAINDNNATLGSNTRRDEDHANLLQQRRGAVSDQAVAPHLAETQTAFARSPFSRLSCEAGTWSSGPGMDLIHHLPVSRVSNRTSQASFHIPYV